MADIELKAAPRHKEVVAGESIPVTAVVINVGKGPVQVPDDGQPAPFEFQLLGADDDTVHFSVSYADFISTLTDPPPPMPPSMRSLAPGESVFHQVDLMRWAKAPPAPGRYRLVAVYEHGGSPIVSRPVPLTIALPRAAALAATDGAPPGVLATLFAHTSADGREVLFHRESEPRKPEMGAAYRRVELEAGKKVSGVAVAVAVGEDGWLGARWTGYLEGDRLGAVLGTRDQAVVKIEPVAVGLESARLVTPARQLSQGRGVFLVAGLAGGAPRVKELTLRRGQPPHTRTIDLQGALPDRILARYAEHGDNADVTLVYAASGPRVQVRSRTVGPDDEGEKGTGRVLLERDGRLLALGLGALGDATGSADVLVQPPGDALKPTYLRVPLAAGEPTEKALAEVQLAKGERVTGWAVGSAGEHHAAAVATDHRVLVADVASGAWRVLDAEASTPSHLTLSAVGTALWATWLDAKVGFRYRQIQ